MYAYDNLTQILDKQGGSALWTSGYTRNEDDQLKTASDPTENASHTYGYDTLNRLSTDVRSAGTTTWTYDAANQVKSITDTSANTSKAFIYYPAHELTSFVKKTGTTTTQNLTLGYNANGDRTSQTDSVGRTTTTLGYDQADRLTSYSRGSTTASYTYNGDGLRMIKTVGTTTTGRVWDLADGLPLMLQDGSASYVTGPGGLPLERVSGSTVYYYYQDQLGSTRAILDSKAKTQATYTYGPFGELKSSTGSLANPFQYAGVQARSGTRFGPE